MEHIPDKAFPPASPIKILKVYRTLTVTTVTLTPFTEGFTDYTMWITLQSQ